MTKYANVGGQLLNNVSTPPLPASCQACSPHWANSQKGEANSDLPFPLNPSPTERRREEEGSLGGGTHKPIFPRGKTRPASASAPRDNLAHPAGMLDDELLMTCSHELQADVETAPSVFEDSNYPCFMSTSIILNWSQKESIVWLLFFKWVGVAFALRPLLGLLLPETNAAIKLPPPGNSSLNGKC